MWPSPYKLLNFLRLLCILKGQNSHYTDPINICWGNNVTQNANTPQYRKNVCKYSACVNVSKLLSTRGGGWILFSGWKRLLQPRSYWHPFHLIRTLGPRVDKTLREIILPGECGGDKLASGSVQESPLCQAEEKGLAGSRGRPRQGKLGGPMLRPPPCLWQTRQWIISPSGTRPSAVGLRGKGAVIQHSAKELPLYVCSMHHKRTYTCLHCVYFHRAQPMRLYFFPHAHFVRSSSIVQTSLWQFQ